MERKREINDQIIVRLKDNEGYMSYCHVLRATIFKEDIPHVSLSFEYGTRNKPEILIKGDEASKIIQHIEDFKKSNKELTLIQLEKLDKGYKVEFYDLVKK